MTKTRSIAQLSAGVAAALLAVAFAGPALSQTPPATTAPAAKPAPAKPAAAPAAKPAAPAAAPAAQAAPGALPQGQGEQLTFASSPWQKVCQEIADEKDPGKPKKKACFTATIITVNGQPFAQMQLSGIEGEPNKGLEIFVPQGFLLQPGMRINFDTSPVALPFSVCTVAPNLGPICVAQTVVNADFINKLKTSKSVSLEMRNPQREVKIPVGNADFAKTFDGPGMDAAVAAEMQRKRVEEAKAAQQKKEQEATAALLKKGQELEKAKQNGQ
ncbi:invasion associated locus B family protein [Xanthobacter autotrophicus DSM 431]|uniref:invasion associated locus B family protein n=1 Tax=Xanthobacter nonsaccharivorans TaxID=3119912 RepID=UPI00372B17E8